MAPKVRATQCRVGVDSALRTSLVHLPASLCNTLVSRNVVAQTLVVEISTDTQTYYCGWTGLSAGHAVLDDPQGQPAERVIVGPLLAALFLPVLRDGMEIQIRLFRSPPLPVAEQVHVVPLDADDWEILSIHAEDVESNMLSQVRAARTGQVLAVQVGRSASTVVRFTVERTSPPSSGGPDGEGSVAVRLSSDTEVVVAPKQRQAASESVETEIPISTPAGPMNASKAATILARVLWRVLPSDFCREDDSLSWTALIPATDELPSAESPAYELVSLAFPHSKACFTKVTCPTHSDTSEREPTSATASAAFGAGDASFSAQPRWPTRHVWLGKELRAKMNLQDYDLIQISAPPPGVAKGLDRANDTRHALEATDKIRLPGMEQVLSQCVETISSVHLQRSLQAVEQGQLDLAEDAVVHPAPYTSSSGVILYGGTGSGKTRIAEVLGQQIALDASLLYRSKYIDCATFVEERMSLVRSHFKEWLDDAAWHAPTLLVLDNLDTLIPADAENVDGTRSNQLGHALVATIQQAIQNYEIFVLAASQSESSLHKSIQSSKIWTETLKIKPPAKDARREILEALVENIIQKGKASSEGAISDDERSLQTRQSVFNHNLSPETSATEAVAHSSHGHREEQEAPADSSQGVQAATTDDMQSHTENGNQIERVSSDQPDNDLKSTETALKSLNLQAEELDWVSLVNDTDGYHVADLQVLTQRAVHQSSMRCLLAPDSSLTLSMDDFRAAQKDFTPFSLRDVKLEDSSTNWSDIGGLHATRQTLRETLEWPTKYAAIFASCPLRLRSGLLLYGYPGCGKTLLASAVAKECGLHFISVKGPEILNKYIGASEKAVRDLFDRAQAAKPCVLFFDEFDSVAPKRGHDSTGVTDRVVNQMLTQMDGAEGLDGVYVLAATSRPDLIDSALLRPGRLDKSLLCDMPSQEDRLDILSAIARKIHLDPTVDLSYWAQRTEGFSGADLQALLYNAHLETIHSSIHDNRSAATDGQADVPSSISYRSILSSTMSNKKQLSGAEQAAFSDRLRRMLGNTPSETVSEPKADHSSASSLVTSAQIEAALQTTRPSVPKEEVMRLKRIYQNFSGDRDASFPNGMASDAIGARTSLM
ncbi:Peroxisome biosynthesis protein pex1 [Malassezia yamatoensis]|uniref:Peroxisomal ATPase PEX1 n=1 Tax=Malassezia yamatoensis TaxID=253288 RepID=A0AAJ5YPS6_9BASI|nr:Peroxisome biosynthesis protein pex1 [Malassezia yamatoensis]